MWATRVQPLPLSLIHISMFWAVAYLSKERITVKKEDQGKVSEGLKLVFKNKNLVCAMMYCFFTVILSFDRYATAQNIGNAISASTVSYTHLTHHYT